MPGPWSPSKYVRSRTRARKGAPDRTDLGLCLLPGLTSGLRPDGSRRYRKSNSVLCHHHLLPLELPHVQLIVRAAHRQQLLVPAALHNLARLQHQDLVRIPDRAQPVRDHKAGAPLEQGFRPSLLWQVDQELFLQRLEAAVDGLAGQDSAAGWQPVAFEQTFGFDTNPLVVEADGQTILLHGVVDRIDRDSAGRLRIVDYKTGSSHQGNQDLLQGRRLQLPLYAMAAQSALGWGEVKEGLYWGLLKGEAGPLKLSTFKRGEERGLQAAVDVALEHLGRIMHGIRQAQFPPAPPKGGCSEYCPASAWCWRYKPGW